VVDCAGLHRFEVMGVLVKPPSDYPGASNLSYDGSVYCAGLLETYYDYRGELLLGGWVGFPTEQEWYSGVRKLTCFLGPTSPPYPSPLFTGRIAP
jgi:hypothetical protein